MNSKSFYVISSVVVIVLISAIVYLVILIKNTSQPQISESKVEQGQSSVSTNKQNNNVVQSVKNKTKDCDSVKMQGAGGLIYGAVLAADGRCWLDRNLGATQVANSSTDNLSYGYHYQWGRPSDGHQLDTSSTVNAQSPNDIPGHANFIYGNSDWRSTQSPNEETLWSGINGGSNNPCPENWRLPTQSEWSTLVTAENISDSNTAYNSTLKLSLAGSRNSSDAKFNNTNDSKGSLGLYWSSSPYKTYAYYLTFLLKDTQTLNRGGGAIFMNSSAKNNRAIGGSVRCIKN